MLEQTACTGVLAITVPEATGQVLVSEAAGRVRRAGHRHGGSGQRHPGLRRRDRRISTSPGASSADALATITVLLTRPTARRPLFQMLPIDLPARAARLLPNTGPAHLARGAAIEPDCIVEEHAAAGPVERRLFRFGEAGTPERLSTHSPQPKRATGVPPDCEVSATGLANPPAQTAVRSPGHSDPMRLSSSVVRPAIPGWLQRLCVPWPPAGTARPS